MRDRIANTTDSEIRRRLRDKRLSAYLLLLKWRTAALDELAAIEAAIQADGGSNDGDPLQGLSGGKDRLNAIIDRMRTIDPAGPSRPAKAALKTPRSKVRAVTR
jgi:hypothetical protein